jgi:hypothetical protein
VDEAEKWLQENDPRYRESSGLWRHVRTGEYKYDQIWERKQARGKFRETPMPAEQLDSLASVSREVFSLEADPGSYPVDFGN